MQLDENFELSLNMHIWLPALWPARTTQRSRISYQNVDLIYCLGPVDMPIESPCHKKCLLLVILACCNDMCDFRIL